MRILVVTPGFYGPQGDVRIPALQHTFERLGEEHELIVHAVTPELGPRPSWVQPWKTSAITKKVDIAWLLWPQRTAGVALALRGAQPTLPIVVSVMGAEATNSVGRDRWRIQACFAAATMITAGSGWLAERLRRAWPSCADKLKVAALLLPPETHLAPKSAPKSTAESAPNSPFRLVAVSSLQPIKQPELLLETVVALRSRGLDARLDVYGWSQPQAETRWNEQISKLGLTESVRHLGFVSPAELRAVLGDYDLLLHPSTHEAQGLALIEAASIGLPCVCRDVGAAGVLKAAGARLGWVNSEMPMAWASAVQQMHIQVKEASDLPPGFTELTSWNSAFVTASRYA